MTTATISEMVAAMVAEDDFNAWALKRQVEAAGGHVIEDPVVVGTSRWSYRSRVILTLDPQKLTGHTAIEWSDPATEYQDGVEPSPEVYPVRPVPALRWERAE